MTQKNCNTGTKSSLNIILADNNPAVHSALRLLLEQEIGFSVTSEAHNFAELLSSVDKKCPDLVLLDWELPGVQGAATIQSLRKKCARITIAAMSSLPEAHSEAIKAGANAFISKGSSPHIIISQIKDLIQMKIG